MSEKQLTPLGLARFILGIARDEERVEVDLSREVVRLSMKPLSEWINTTVSLPDEVKPVVGLWDPDPRDGFTTRQVCYYDGSSWMTWNCGTFDARLIPPTYWMPLPEAPGGK